MNTSREQIEDASALFSRHVQEQTDPDKLEIIKQWNNDPCEGHVADGLEVGSRAFYERVDRHRFQDFAPWMKSTMDYGQFAGQSLLEVGFGMGTDLFQFASGGAIVSGIDLTPRHYEIASRRFQLYDIPADLRLGDAENMPYEDESFDAVYTFGVIHHSPNTEKIVDEIYRVLKPGGTAIIAVYYKWSIFYLIQVILSNHIISGGFLREPFRKTMARIEHRENEDAWPLVKVYSRRQMRSMLKKFAAVSFKVRHLGRGEFGYFRRFVPPSLPAKLETKMGWFLIAKCVK